MNVVPLCYGFVSGLAALRKHSGPWRPVHSPVRTTGSSEQVQIKHHPNVPLLGSISVHCFSPHAPSKWAWHLPDSLHISFLSRVVSEALLLLHPKEGKALGGLGKVSSEPFCETPHQCKAHQMLPKHWAVTDMRPWCKEGFLGCWKKNLPPPPNLVPLKSPKLFLCPSTQLPHIQPPPIAPKLVQRQWDRVALPPSHIHRLQGYPELRMMAWIPVELVQPVEGEKRLEDQGKGRYSRVRGGWRGIPRQHWCIASMVVQLCGGDAAQPAPASTSHKAAALSSV